MRNADRVKAHFVSFSAIPFVRGMAALEHPHPSQLQFCVCQIQNLAFVQRFCDSIKTLMLCGLEKMGQNHIICVIYIIYHVILFCVIVFVREGITRIFWERSESVGIRQINCAPWKEFLIENSSSAYWFM